MDSYESSSRSLLANPWVYIGATLAWTWAFWGAVILLNLSLESTPGFALLFLGVLGPLVTGIGFTYLTRDSAGRRDYWKRIIDIRRIGLKWLLILLLLIPLVNGLSAVLDILNGGTGAVWGETLTNAFSNPLGLVFSAMFAILIPFIEEPGWRGYVLDRLQETRTALMSSLILGLVWALWHLPLFFIADTYQAGLGVGTQAFWLFLIGIVVLSFAITWIYNNTARSTLAIILFHGMVNFTGELFDITEQANTYSIILLGILAIVIALLWGSRNFARQLKQEAPAR